ncbi:MAG TPA: hypothetical protein VK186_00610 [Candidatus Deferrimicrobium sp.]|nr:hypothetical protein [Candidatus Deferrimicrobium sp.]
MTKFVQISILIAIPIALIVTLNFVIDLPSASLPLNGKLNDVQKQAISVLLESAKILNSFALAIAGALAFFIKEKYAAKKNFSTAHVIVLSICGISCLLTIFFGQMILSLIIEMLANDIIDILSVGIIYSVRAQYGSLLLALSSLLMFVYLSFALKRQKLLKPNKSNEQVGITD